MKPATHLHSVPIVRMRESLPPHSICPQGVAMERRNNFTLSLRHYYSFLVSEDISSEVPHLNYFLFGIRGVGIAQSVERRATGWTDRVRFPAVLDFLSN
jgi:hypothetical protein